MKMIAKGIAFVLFFVATSISGFAQSAREQAETPPAREAWEEEEFEIENEATGVASYNIEEYDETEEAESGFDDESGAYRVEQTETIRIYSGRQDGNNIVRKVEVPLPEGSPASSFSYREYQPH